MPADAWAIRFAVGESAYPGRPQQTKRDSSTWDRKFGAKWLDKV